MSKHVHVVGQLVNYQLKRGEEKLNKTEAAHCWRKVTSASVVPKGNPNGIVNIMGNVFCVQSVEMKHFFNPISKYTLPNMPPVLSRKNLKLTIGDFEKLQEPTRLMPNPEKQFAINIMCYAFPEQARAACIKYDYEHRLPPRNNTLSQVDYFNFAIRKLAERDEIEVSQEQKNMKALVVAHMYLLFNRMFDDKASNNHVDFPTLMLFPLKLLLKMFCVFHSDGPSIAFEPIKFEFTDEGLLIGSAKYMDFIKARLAERDRNRNASDNNNNNNAVQAPTYELNDDPNGLMENTQYQTSATGDDDGEVTFPPIKIHLTYDRAAKFYQEQKTKGVDPAVEDEFESYDDAEERANDFINSMGVFRTSEAALRSGINVNVVCPNGFEFVAVSSDFKKTKVNPLDMRSISEQDWIQLLLYDYIEARYNEFKEFGVYANKITKLIGDVLSSGDSPLAELTIVKMEETIKYMMDTDSDCNSFTMTKRSRVIPHKRLIVYDKEAKKVLSVKELETAFEDKEKGVGFLKNGENRLVIGLGMLMGQEISIYKELKSFVSDMKQVHMDFMKERMAMLDGTSEACEHGQSFPFDVYRSGAITYSDEQTKALFMAEMLPVLLVSAPGGRGKSEIMCKMFLNFKKQYPKAKFVFTSFKNDTVNQMKERIERAYPGLREDPNVFFRTNDSIKINGGISTVTLNKETKEVKAETVAPDFVFVDEAGMSSTGHILALMTCFDMFNVKKFLLFGDPDQLLPILPGCPFVSMVHCLPDATMKLVRNYRTDNEKLNRFVEEIRNKTFTDFSMTNSRYFDGDLIENFNRGSNFMVCDNLIDDHYLKRDVMTALGFKIFSILNALPQLRYEDIMAVTPYNATSTFISWCFNHHFFEKPLIRRNARQQVDEDEQTTNNNVNDVLISNERKRQKMSDSSRFYTMDQAIDYAYHQDKKYNKVSDMFATKSTTHPIMYLGQDVCITKTDKTNKMIAQGRVAKITHIIDHSKGKKVLLQWFTEGNRPPNDVIIHQDTSDDMRTDCERTVIVDGNTVMTFKRSANIYNLLKPAKCCTVHQAQGRQGRVVFSIHPGGMLNASDIAYTSASRAQSKCITLTTPTVFLCMQTNKRDEPLSIQEDLISSDKDLMNDLKDLRTEAEKLMRASNEIAALADFADQDTGVDNDDDLIF